MALSSTFMISHSDLFGLRQAWLHRRGTGYTPPPFTQRGLYRRVRHPLMAGFVIVFWATPVMTAGHLLFAAAATGYILVGIWFEERDLETLPRRGLRRLPGQRARAHPGPAAPAAPVEQSSSIDVAAPGRHDDPASTCWTGTRPRPGRSWTRIAAAGIDHVCCADHVSFLEGLGFDGLVQATALAALHPSLRIYCGLYLLPLRHPVLVARQLADVERLAPGRLTFGVGIGGEDRHEVEICGVDPATRGARMDECLTVLRELLTGQPVTFHGRFFDLDEAVITPAAPGIPLVVGGRSDAAIRRQAGSATAGWASGTLRGASRPRSDWRPRKPPGPGGPARRPGTRCRCGAGSRTPGRRRGPCLAPAMEAFYELPFERFERYCPYGTADDVAGFLAPYMAAGCTEFNLIPRAPDLDQAVAGVAAVRAMLAGARAPRGTRP